VRTAILRHRDFRLLWAAGTVSGLGSWLLVVAVPAQLYRLTGSPAATGTALAVEALPAMLVAPWAGVLVDRWDRRATMVAADLCAAAGVALMLLGTSPGRLPAVYAGLLVENVAVAFGVPAARAVLPAVAGTGEALAAANAVSAFAAGVVRLVGPPLGTLLLSTGGLPAAAGVDAATYLVSAALLVRLRLPAGTRPAVRPASAPVTAAEPVAATAPVTAARTPGAAPVRQAGRELRDGWRLLAGTPTLRALLFATWAFWAANAVATALLVPFVAARLGRPGADVGYLVSGLGVGYLAGAAVSRPALARHRPQALLAGAYALIGAGFLVMFNAPGLVAAAVAAVCVGVPGAVALVATRYALQAGTPDPVLGRVSAAFYASDALAAVTGGLLAPALTAALGLAGTLNACGVAVLAVAAATARSARHRRAETPAPSRPLPEQLRPAATRGRAGRIRTRRPTRP